MNHSNERPDDPLTRGLVLGALFGCALGYLCFTASGRRLHRRIDSWLDTAVEELRALERTQERVRAAVDEGRRAFQSGARSSVSRPSSPRTDH